MPGTHRTTRRSYGKRGAKVTPVGRPCKWESWRKVGRFYGDKPIPEFIDWLAAEMGASGLTAQQICDSHKGAPSYRVMMKWLAMDRELEQKFLAAQRIGIHARIERLIQEADELLAAGKAGKLHKDQVSAFTAFAKAIQWVAARWHKDVYGDQQQRSTVIPVQFVTNLDFGQEGVKRDNPQDVYSIEAEVEQRDEQDVG